MTRRKPDVSETWTFAHETWRWGWAVKASCFNAAVRKFRTAVKADMLAKTFPDGVYRTQDAGGYGGGNWVVTTKNNTRTVTEGR